MDSNVATPPEGRDLVSAEETTDIEDFAAASAPAFESIWDNPEDAAYDAL